ncbi:ATP-binding protein [Actinocrispum sp. NPDC049592]|uniref:ATP-binding protein n=1 Tax=Actinocrispum sp. NPDC049592 TaxID=3154835 RepID=UPI00343954A9
MTSDEPPFGDDIEVKVGADAAQLPVLRAIASVVAMRQDLDLDAIADFKMAVDEAGSMLVLKAVGQTNLTCRFTPTKAEIKFAATALSESGEWPDAGSFGWHVLSTLADEVDASVTPATGGHLLRIEIVKRNGLGHE